MNFKKSVVIPALLPASEQSLEEFKRIASVLKGKGISVLEFYSPPEQAADRKQILDDFGFSGFFLAAGFQKKNGLSLCSPDEEERLEALRKTCVCIDSAKASGADTVLITSGRYPGPERESDSWKALESSVCFLMDYADGLKIVMEQGDRSLDAKQLAGPIEETLAFARKIRARYPGFGLTMDTSHTKQLREDYRAALDFAAPCCEHIHLANCVLLEGHPLYGDKHPLFDYPDSSYTLSELQALGRELAKSYPKPFTMAIEIINRDSDPWAFVDKVLLEEQWFFEL